MHAPHSCISRKPWKSELKLLLFEISTSQQDLYDVNLTTRISEPECDSQSDSATFNDEISLMILKYNKGDYSEGPGSGIRSGYHDIHHTNDLKDDKLLTYIL